MIYCKGGQKNRIRYVLNLIDKINQDLYYDGKLGDSKLRIFTFGATLFKESVVVKTSNHKLGPIGVAICYTANSIKNCPQDLMNQKVGRGCGECDKVPT